MKIYTKTGDQGFTMLADGRKVRKTSLRIESYGTADELNSVIAIFRDLALDFCDLHPEITHLLEQCLQIQDEIFQLGSELANPAQKNLGSLCIGTDNIQRLEAQIDAMWGKLPPLRNFVIPGGCRLNSQLHLCRCICRRFERNLNQLDREEEVRPELLVYANRLSDWLFAAARFVSHTLKAPELLWNAKKC